ncbi:uncharacterized protein LOC132621077 isoform X2 [Lycium barbarum]|uniref:uncharacterized protein LOC132621077 isoform X2 n=1 Tax=Lycium barbarum TaxID=112863 RepID=UPI00293F4042|nr:uncharacterized protein LOC132621077 isoform X2 [Lycium barbarum]
MELPIPNRVKKAWDEWNIQVFLLLSLFLQAISLLLAPFRKRSRNKWLMLLIWLSYLAADWAPGFVIGLITNAVTTSCPSSSNSPNEEYYKSIILTFWTPFLLLHLGGADTITSFALEDNELWIRYVFAFIFQVVASAYVFYLSLPQNTLWPPTLLNFLAGIVKCIERARVQYLATRENLKNSSAEILKKSAGPNDATKLKNLDVVKFAYDLFERYKGLIVGDKFTPEEYKASQKLVCNNIKDGNEAFRVVEAEMYIIYEALHTKAPLLVRSKKKYVLISRSVYWVLLVTTLGLFAFMDKGGFRSVDVAVTYALLFGTVILDAIAVLIMIFSSYLVVASMLQSPILGILVRRPSELVMRIWSRCFPQTVHQYNLISHCRQQRSRSCQNSLSFFGLAGFWDELKYVSQAERLQRRIFSKAKPVFDLPRRKTDGQLCPKDHWAYHFPYPTESSHKLFYATSDEEFLILSHIATEICFHFDDDHSNVMILNSLKSNHVKDFRVWCKLMSDYVLYLVAFNPSCMETASKYQKTIEETLAEVAELFLQGNEKSLTDQRKACEEILGLAKTNNITNDSMKEDDQLVLDESEKGNRSKGSILYRASLLANVLISSQDAYTRWSRLFDVWMERLLEAAKWSRPNFHAQNLCKGGEFLSLVWLLMAHLGSGSQYQVEGLNLSPLWLQPFRPASPQFDTDE